ncbi:uncharacterized protein LOC131254027 [Magnolia sinica]|uniref:uncharacterized protein LOC131254027 n=1 Tax=Magnolia sinica TaxID=86752 RepID=UPI00265AC85F|nr:uncharacterized protein LOC131254027 [Magnolia sinica]
MEEEKPQQNDKNASAFPAGRVKKMVKLDGEIDKVSSEALFLISLSTDLFLEFLAEKSMEVAVQKKRKIIKLDHLRSAARKHQPTHDFLLDSLPIPSRPSVPDSTAQIKSRRPVEKPLPPGARRIDAFFSKSADVAE